MWATPLRCPHIHRPPARCRRGCSVAERVRAQWRDDDLPDWQARRRPKPPSPGSTPCPTRCRARMPGQYSTRCGRRPCRDAADPVEGTARLFLCARCRVQVLVCSCCDRGQIYCAGGCAQKARHHSQRAAGRRYQASRRGRVNHAARARRWRAQKNVTHRGSPTPPPDDEVSVDATVTASDPAVAASSDVEAPSRGDDPPIWRCRWCGRCCPPFVRMGFLRRRCGGRSHDQTSRRAS